MDRKIELLSPAGNLIKLKYAIAYDEIFPATLVDKDCIDIISNAAEKQKLRRKTKPSPEVKRRRVEAKRQRGKIKKLRRQPPAVED